MIIGLLCGLLFLRLWQGAMGTMISWPPDVSNQFSSANHANSYLETALLDQESSSANMPSQPQAESTSTWQASTTSQYSRILNESTIIHCDNLPSHTYYSQHHFELFCPPTWTLIESLDKTVLNLLSPETEARNLHDVQYFTSDVMAEVVYSPQPIENAEQLWQQIRPFVEAPYSEPYYKNKQGFFVLSHNGFLNDDFVYHYLLLDRHSYVSVSYDYELPNPVFPGTTVRNAKGGEVAESLRVTQ